MGKPTGFLDYERVEATAVSPKERIKNFNEFHTPLSEDEQRKQSSRCMDCGVPFCQSGMTIKGMTSGCPLNNLIPEWNDLLYTGNWEQAYHRLHKTSNFPVCTSVLYCVCYFDFCTDGKTSAGSDYPDRVLYLCSDLSRRCAFLSDLFHHTVFPRFRDFSV